MKNRRWVLASHAEGDPKPGNWTLEEDDLPRPGPGQILVRTRWLSVDPYMRGRIGAGANYAAGVRIGEVMQGGGIGEVVESRHPSWQVGELVETMGYGWQEYAVLSPGQGGPAAVNRVDPAIAPPQAALSWLGMPGLTAYVGLTEMARPKPGDTVVVSAASGAVGQVVGQLAHAMGATPIAVAGSDEKISYCRSIGYADGINYRTSDDLDAELRRTCPNGVDVFFDNTGGPIHDAVMRNLALRARIVICGRIATVNEGIDKDIGVRASARLIVSRATMHGLLVFDWWHRRDEANARLAGLHRDGRLAFREDVIDGFEKVPEAFLRMLKGGNFGKQLVRIP